jgi:hypothetical protein
MSESKRSPDINTKRQAASPAPGNGGEHRMFTRNRALAAVAVIGAVAAAAPVAAASAATTPAARTTAATTMRFSGPRGQWNHGYGHGYGNSWNHGYGYGNQGYGPRSPQGYGNAGIHAGLGNAGVHAGAGVFLPGV